MPLPLATPVIVLLVAEMVAVGRFVVESWPSVPIVIPLPIGEAVIVLLFMRPWISALNPIAVALIEVLPRLVIVLSWTSNHSFVIAPAVLLVGLKLMPTPGPLVIVVFEMSLS